MSAVTSAHPLTTDALGGEHGAAGSCACSTQRFLTMIMAQKLTEMVEAVNQASPKARGPCCGGGGGGFCLHPVSWCCCLQRPPSTAAISAGRSPATPPPPPAAAPPPLLPAACWCLAAAAAAFVGVPIRLNLSAPVRLNRCLLTGASSRFWQSRQNTVKPKFDATAAFESDQVTGICC
jgi:hypothetical protein